MNNQTQLQKTKRSVFGKIIKWAFIGFNILMAIWLISGMASASESISQTTNDAEQAGAVIGTGLGAIMIIFLWLAGAVILGIMTLLTRPKR